MREAEAVTQCPVRVLRYGFLLLAIITFSSWIETKLP